MAMTTSHMLFYSVNIQIWWWRQKFTTALNMAGVTLQFPRLDSKRWWRFCFIHWNIHAWSPSCYLDSPAAPRLPSVRKPSDMLRLHACTTVSRTSPQFIPAQAPDMSDNCSPQSSCYSQSLIRSSWGPRRDGAETRYLCCTLSKLLTFRIWEQNKKYCFKQ